MPDCAISTGNKSEMCRRALELRGSRCVETVVVTRGSGIGASPNLLYWRNDGRQALLLMLELPLLQLLISFPYPHQ